MFDFLLFWDELLFLEINGFKSPFFDDFFYIFSGQKIWFLFALSIVYSLIVTGKKDWWIVVLAVVLTICISDQISSSIIKPLVGRLRPSNDPMLEGMVQIVQNYRGGGFSFVSSHAANGVAFATFSSFLFKNKIYSATIFIWAFATMYSRIYLGVHYPIDVVGGALVGFSSGFLVFWAAKTVRPKIEQQHLRTKDSILILLMFLITLAIMSIWHNKLVFLG